MALEFTDVPVRRWRRTRYEGPVLVYSKEYKRVMDLIGRAIAAGGAVEANHRIVRESPAVGMAYDVMNVRIDMPKGVPMPTATRRARGAA